MQRLKTDLLDGFIFLSVIHLCITEVTITEGPDNGPDAG